MSLVPYAASTPYPDVQTIANTIRAGRNLYSTAKGAYRVYGSLPMRQRMRRARMSLRGESRRRTPPRGVTNHSKIGESMSSPDNKKYESLAGPVSQADTRTQYYNDLTSIPKTTVSDVNARTRHFANVKGFSVNWIVKNNGAPPLTVNIAILSPKGAKTMTTAGFFRDYTASRDIDFSNGLNTNELHTLPVSTDKFSVLKHQRFIIGGIGNTANAPSNKSFNIGKIWCPLNRQIRYNDDTDDKGENRVFLVYWFDLVTNVATAGPTFGAAQVSFRTCTYFDDSPRPY